MDFAFGRRNMAVPLLLVNLVMYLLMLGFAASALDSFINGHQYHPILGGNAATFYFVVFAALAGIVGVAAKAAGAYHVGARAAWKPQGLAVAASLATVAWAVTGLAFGLACKEMRVGGERGWRLRALEGLAVMLAFTQLLLSALLHAAIAGDRCGPGCPAGDDHPTGPCSLM